MGDIAEVDLSDNSTFLGGFPHEFFVRLRAEEPVRWHQPTRRTPDGEGFWVVSTHEGVREVLKDPRTFSSDRGGLREKGGTGIKDETSAGKMLNQTDDPQHLRLRSLVNKGFTPAVIAQLEADLRAFTEDNIAQFKNDVVDFVDEFARELPSQAICMILGVPEADRPMLLELMDSGLSSESGSILDPTVMRSIREYAIEFIAKKRKDPDESMTSAIISAQVEDGSRLSDKELYWFFELLFLAGSETTRSAISGGVLEFARQPEVFESLRADPSLVGSAVEEIVRWTTPSIYKRRTAASDTLLGNVQIGRGDKVTVWEMSANRDEAVFAEPFVFDIGRSPNPHLGFGFGVHYCLGASLARLELKVALECLLENYSGFHLVAEPEWIPNNRLLGLRHLFVRPKLKRPA